MLVIDEINCDSLENNENQETAENVDENTLLLPENNETNPKTDSKDDAIDENKTENNEKPTENDMGVVDTSEEEPKQLVEENNSVENKTETNGKNEDNCEHIEGVVPENNESSNSNAVITENASVSEQTSVDKPESSSDSNSNTASEDKLVEEIASKGENNCALESTLPTKQYLNEGCAELRSMTYAEVVAKSSGVPESEHKSSKSVKLEDRSPESVLKGGSIGTEEDENENKTNLLDTNSLKAENMFDIDDDIEKFNERLKNLDSMVKKENLEGEADEDDPLDGFDVIDETNNEDNNRTEDNTEAVIDLSD